MLKEYDLIVLTAGVGDLKAGSVGTIVHVHPDREAYVVEFMASDGSTVAVVTIPANQARPVTGEDIYPRAQGQDNGLSVMLRRPDGLTLDTRYAGHR